MNLKLNIANIDEAKADATSTRTMEYVFPGQEGEPVIITYSPIKAGELFSFLVSVDGGGNLNTRALLQKKVQKIENFTISDKKGKKREIKSAEDVMNLRPFPELESFIATVAGRIYNESRLTEDEEKNSESATNASGQEPSEGN